MVVSARFLRAEHVILVGTLEIDTTCTLAVHVDPALLRYLSLIVEFFSVTYIRYVTRLFVVSA